MVRLDAVLVIGIGVALATAVARGETKRTKPPDAKLEGKPTAAKPSKPDDGKPDIAKATDDPVLGKADRVEGDDIDGVVSFTFDDGPNPDTTPAVIEACEKYGIPATFFIVSRRIVGKLGARSREVLARAVGDGYTIGSHSWSHPNLRGAQSKTLALEIDEAVRTLSKEIDRPIGLFRAPFGALDNNGRAWLKKRGLTEVFWSEDTVDWRATDAERLRKKVGAMIVRDKGGVVLMHDVKPITAKAIANIFDDLEAENCRRVAAKEEPIWPVPIHYFLRDKKKARPVPDDAKKIADAYRTGFAARCAKRPPPPPAPAPAPAKPDAKPGAKSHSHKN